MGEYRDGLFEEWNEIVVDLEQKFRCWLSKFKNAMLQPEFRIFPVALKSVLPLSGKASQNTEIHRHGTRLDVFSCLHTGRIWRRSHNIMAQALEGCVSSLRESLVLLDSSIQRIDSGVSDFPRLSKVLRSTRVSRPFHH
jgi:hypothetical protein